MDTPDHTSRKKSVFCQTLSSVVEHYFPKIKRVQQDDNSTDEAHVATTVHQKVPQILSILQENDLINQCMQDPTSTKTLEIFIKRLWLLCQSREPANKWAGFIILEETFRHCNHETLNAHFEDWTKNFQDLLLSKHNRVDKGIAHPRGLGAWVTLSSRASEWPDLKRACAAHVPSLISTLLAPLAPENDCPDDTKIASLSHLCTLVDTMYSSVKPQVVKIEAACLSLLLHHNFQIRQATSQLFAFLPKCFTTSTMHYTPFMAKTIEQTELFLDVILAGLEENSNRKKQAHHASLPTVVGMSTEQLLDGFKGLTTCITSMFEAKVQYPCELPVDAILALISRVFFVNFGMTNISSAVTDSDHLRPAERLALIPIVHSITLELLDALIMKLKRHLIPHSRTILRIIAQVHTRTLTRTVTTQKLAYTALAHLVEFVCGAGVWGNSAGNAASAGGVGGVRGGTGGTGGMIEEALFTKILRDTAPPKKVVQKSILDVKLAGKSRHNNAGGGKKKKKKGGSDAVEDTGANTATQAVTRKALKALYAILLHTGSHIPPQQRTKIDQTIVAHLLTVTSDKNSYADSKYKVGIYKCLKAAVLRPVPSCPPILVYALRLFCYGVADDCFKVARICKEGAAICENQVHPYVPTLPSLFIPSSSPSLSSSSSLAPLAPPSSPPLSPPSSPSPPLPSEPIEMDTNRKRKERESESEEEEEEAEATKEKKVKESVEKSDDEMDEGVVTKTNGTAQKVIEVEESESEEEEETTVAVVSVASSSSSSSSTFVATSSITSVSSTTVSSSSISATLTGGDDDDDDIEITDAPPDSDQDSDSEEN